ncbi:MAG TPA: pitrilysin family protein [Pyrinomonadaceae bacterium]|nr:pitrilysin family protein [Pyrinomonadaceae bacterium]
MKNLGFKTKSAIFSMIAVCAAALIVWRVADPLPTGFVSQAAVPEIAVEKFTLKNGLTVIVHEDHRSPWTAINLWFHAGTRNERPGSHGIAHLSEHLMFSGTPSLNENVAKVLKRMGVDNATASTDHDRTRVMMNVPQKSFDDALRLAADLMAGTVEALTEKKVDAARREIAQEVARNDDSPYIFAEDLLRSRIYPAEHPYARHPLRSIDGLNSVSLADVKEWFRTYYCPANAVLVVAGDLKPQTVRRQVEQYFGDIQPGQALSREKRPVPGAAPVRRETVEGKIPRQRLYMVWNVPGYADPDIDRLDLIRHYLTLKLEERKPREKPEPTVEILLKSYELSGELQVRLTASTSEQLELLEREVERQIKEVMSQGPAPAELEEIKTELLSSLSSDLEQIGGFGGKAGLLAISEVFAGDPQHYRKAYQRMLETTPADVKAVSSRWLAASPYVLHVKGQ